MHLHTDSLSECPSDCLCECPNERLSEYAYDSRSTDYS